MKVRLSAEDHAHACAVARERQLHARGHGLGDRYGFRGDGLAIHEQGCVAELALARWLDVEWIGFSADFERLPADVGGAEVRSTAHAAGRLLIHPDDRLDAPFVLARTHDTPDVEFVGWMIGRDACRAEWWRALQPGRPCFVVPSDALVPMRLLGAHLATDELNDHIDRRG